MRFLGIVVDRIARVEGHDLPAVVKLQLPGEEKDELLPLVGFQQFLLPGAFFELDEERLEAAVLLAVGQGVVVVSILSQV